jgi:phosphopantothenoylcysteine decarboxylase/phosphopantothenate--cysteine ligase
MRVLLGVTGGIAAYKAAELTRELQRRQIDVQVALSQGAAQFVTPLTFAALSGHPVLTSLWTPTVPETVTGDTGRGDRLDDSEQTTTDFAIEHIRIAQEIDALVIAPATANVMAKLAHGIADDLLSTIALATTAPVLLAPAMNVNMWNHPATQANVRTLLARGVHFVEPAPGYLACGMTGDGRLAEIGQIADAVVRLLAMDRSAARQTADETESEAEQQRSQERFLITAGGTREPIDPVRFLGNRSSGRMGHALAEAALARGAAVILITAATALPKLPCETHYVETAAQMHEAVLTHLPRATAVLMAAAVADYRVAQPAQQKRKKTDTLTLELVRTPDILADVVQHRSSGTLVLGFAAETERLLDEARRKLREKGLDAIVANDVSLPGLGFDSERNAGVFLTSEDEVALLESSKREMADDILNHLQTLRLRNLVRR